MRPIPCLLWPSGWIDHGTWRGGGRWFRPHCARWGPSSPPPKREQSAQFSAHFYCGQTAGCIKMPLGMEVGLSPGDFVLDGNPAPSQKRGGTPQFSAHVYCGQTAGWIKMPLGTQVGLSPDDIVLDGDPAPPKKGHSPQFSAHAYCGHMYQDTTWYGGRPWPRRHCVRWGPALPPLKGHSPQFSANIRCGQTAEWTKMPLGMEVGLGPGNFVFDGDQLPRKRHSHHPIFGLCLLWPNGWMDEDATWYGSRPHPMPHCARR